MRTKGLDGETISQLAWQKLQQQGGLVRLTYGAPPLVTPSVIAGTVATRYVGKSLDGNNGHPRIYQVTVHRGGDFLISRNYPDAAIALAEHEVLLHGYFGGCAFIEQIATNHMPIAKHLSTPCPLCDAKFVLRKGKWGHFYGCMNYPECKGSASVNGKVTEKTMEEFINKKDHKDRRIQNATID